MLDIPGNRCTTSMQQQRLQSVRLCMSPAHLTGRSVLHNGGVLHRHHSFNHWISWSHLEHFGNCTMHEQRGRQERAL